MPYKLWKNGVAETKDRSIIETVKAMVQDLDMLMFLWAETCSQIVYTLNKGPHRVLKDKKPKEAFNGEKHYVSHFRVFGFHVYIHIHEEKRN
jgi:hypothetical protein